MQSGWLVTADGRQRYPVRDFIPRFAPESNYADNFGLQWNKFRQTQLDSHSAPAGLRDALLGVNRLAAARPRGRALFPFVYSLGVLQHTPDVGKGSRRCRPW